MKLVRLYPRNPDRGWFIQTYVDPQLGLKFVSERGWYQVSDEIAEALKEVRQKRYDLRSGPAFAIAKDKEEARLIERTEINPPEKEEEVVGTAEAPIPIVAKTSDKRPGARKTPQPRKRSMTAG
jgi:hypothetical protein